jgi:hypothetical protein
LTLFTMTFAAGAAAGSGSSSRQGTRTCSASGDRGAIWRAWRDELLILRLQSQRNRRICLRVRNSVGIKRSR